MQVHVFIDTETTGLGHRSNPPREDAIVEVGIAYRINGNIKSWGAICNPGEKYYAYGRAKEAFAVNNIKEDEILNAEDSATIANELKLRLNEAWPIQLHAYNIPFDKPFLIKEPWNLEADWGIDVMNMAHAYFKLPANSRIRLETVLKNLNIVPDGTPHRAETDARTTLLAYEAMLKSTSKR
jgi:DNA polymerase III alpha subunit (gram-positive type)